MSDRFKDFLVIWGMVAFVYLVFMMALLGLHALIGGAIGLLIGLGLVYVIDRSVERPKR